jgi:hypothetical protein
LILIDSAKVLIADDGQADVDLARDAAIQMSDAPTQHAGTATPSNVVSLFQAGAVALRATRVINWRGLDGAAAYVDEANYLDTGSPA